MQHGPVVLNYQLFWDKKTPSWSQSVLLGIPENDILIASSGADP